MADDYRSTNLDGYMSAYDEQVGYFFSTKNKATKSYLIGHKLVDEYGWEMRSFDFIEGEKKIAVHHLHQSADCSPGAGEAAYGFELAHVQPRW